MLNGEGEYELVYFSLLPLPFERLVADSVAVVAEGLELSQNTVNTMAEVDSVPDNAAELRLDLILYVRWRR